MARRTSQPSTATESPTHAFFASLAERGNDPLLRTANGTIRFDVDNGGRVEHWLVALSDGDVKVSRANRRADGVFSVDRRLLDRLVSGEANAFAAVLRGALAVQGDIGLLLSFQRIFPGPPSASRPTASRPKPDA